jgi:hypothetical protein
VRVRIGRRPTRLDARPLSQHVVGARPRGRDRVLSSKLRTCRSDVVDGLYLAPSRVGTTCYHGHLETCRGYHRQTGRPVTLRAAPFPAADVHGRPGRDAPPRCASSLTHMFEEQLDQHGQNDAKLRYIYIYMARPNNGGVCPAPGFHGFTFDCAPSAGCSSVMKTWATLWSSFRERASTRWLRDTRSTGTTSARRRPAPRPLDGVLQLFLPTARLDPQISATCMNRRRLRRSAS